MNPAESEYARFRIGQASDTLRDAQSLLEAGSLHSVVNRLYYACFYAVSALLFTGGFTSTKHRGIISAFDREWINTGRLPKTMGRFLHQVFDARLQGDYDYPVTLQRQDVEDWVKEAQTFVSRISELIDERLAG